MKTYKNMENAEAIATEILSYLMKMNLLVSHVVTT